MNRVDIAYCYLFFLFTLLFEVLMKLQLIGLNKNVFVSLNTKTDMTFYVSQVNTLPYLRSTHVMSQIA